MSVPSIIPAQFCSPQTKSSGPPGSHSLSLEVAKEIWRKYPKLDSITKKPAAGIRAPTSSLSANALELNLGTQSQPGDTAFRNNTMAQSTDDPPGKNGEPNVSNADARMDSPTSELAVDELLPTASDSMDITPDVVSNSLPYTRSEPATADRRHLGAQHSPSTLTPHEHSMAQVRATLMDSFHKTVQLRYPGQDMDRAQLEARFTQTLSDAEVRDFVRMGKEVVDQLRHTGKLEEAKRKYLGEGPDEEDRQTRRRVEGSSSLDPISVPDHSEQNNRRGAETATRAKSDRSTSAQSNNSTPARSERLLRAITPKAPRAMLANNWKDSPPPASPNRVPRPDSSAAVRRESPKQVPPTSGHDTSDDVPMFIDSPSPRPDHLETGHIQISQPPPDPPDDPSSATKQGQGQPSPGRGEGESITQPGASLPPEVLLKSARILLAKVGQPSGDIVDASFELDEAMVAAAQRWAQRSKQFDPAALHMRLYLTSIPKEAAEAAYTSLPPDHQPSLLAQTVSHHPVAWPRQGTYYVSLNRGRPGAKSWSDHFFTPSSPPLDLSGAVLPGRNDIQFVQLADQSQLLFLVLAIPPSEAEMEEVLATHSRRAAWNQVSDNYKPKTGIKLRLDALSC